MAGDDKKVEGDDDRRTIKFQLMLSPAEVEAIDDWSFANRIRTRARAIRTLVLEGMLYQSAFKSVMAAAELVTAMASGEETSENIDNYFKALTEFTNAARANQNIRDQIDLLEKEAKAIMARAEVLEAEARAKGESSRQADKPTRRPRVPK